VIKPPPLAIAPFDAASARKHQTAWTQHLKAPVEHVNTIGMSLRLVPPGEFQVEGEGAHAVRISRPFFLGAHEVTVGQFRAFVDATGYKTHAETNPLGGIVWNPSLRRTVQDPHITWRSPGFSQTEQHPVCCVTWKDADAFCRWLAGHEGKPYRLPTEAEWEYSCRAGTTTPFHYGGSPDPRMMNVSLRGTTPVGTFPPNAFGLHDMHGNVYEYCLDAKRTYEPGLAIDPRGPDEGAERATRGGCYSSGGAVLRSDFRSSCPVDHAYSGNGFRVLLEWR
jgi:formylglycine-generating enzyme required for sulfatase activity